MAEQPLAKATMSEESKQEVIGEDKVPEDSSSVEKSRDMATLPEEPQQGLTGEEKPPKHSSSTEKSLDTSTAPEEPKQELVGNNQTPKDGSSAESQNEEAEGEPKGIHDKYLVDWDGPDDPENPMNWTARKKALNLAALSFLTFVTPLASSMFAPGVGQVLQEFQSSNTLLASFVVSVYLLGYAFGPLLCAPLSELYGRAIVYRVTTVLFIAFTLACDFAPSLNSLIGFRFLAGSAGSAPLVLGSGTIADTYPRERRGLAMALFSMGPLLGPVIGPVAGAFLAEDEGWRWVFRLITILGGVCLVGVLLFMPETWVITLLERKARRLRKSTGDSNYRSKEALSGTPKEEFLKALWRPTMLVIKSPTVLIFCLYMSVVYGYLYLVFTTITEVYEFQYGWSTGVAGLSFIGLGIGMIAGMAFFGATSDGRIKKLREAGKPTPPEVRLVYLVPAAFLLPIGFFWYGWSADKHIHWIMPLIGLFWIGLGTIGMFMGVQTYLVDCFPKYAASVTSSNTVLRSLVGALLPLAGQPLYQALGLGWGNSLLAFIALALAPLPFLFLKYGERIRTNPKFQPQF